jgi:hypothetical protein
MKPTKNMAKALLTLIALVSVISFAAADIEQTTVTFVIPSTIDHSLSYGGTCSSANFYFVEEDASIDGTQAKINASSDSAGSNMCQDAGTAGIVITNDGSTAVDVVMNMSTAYPAGTNLKVAQADAGYQAVCDGTADSDGCADIPALSAGVTVAASVAGQGGTQELWLWANMSNFNSGISGSDTATLNSQADAS